MTGTSASTVESAEGRDKGGRATVRRFALLLVAVLLPVFVLTIGDDPSPDVGSAHFGAWRMVETSTPWIEDMDYLDDHPLRHVWVTQSGEHEVVSRSPGVVAASIPAYLLTQSSEFSNVPGGVTASLLTTLGLLFLYLALVTRVAPGLAFGVTLVLGLGTPVWSVAADGVWPHTLTVFAIGGMSWACATERWWLVGLFGGIGLWGRSHMALVVAVLGLTLAVLRRRPLIALKVGLPALALLALMMCWTRWVFGAWRLTGSYQVNSLGELSERYPNLMTNELGLFFALERGVFAWTPVILLLLPALVRGWKDVADWAKVLAVAGLAYTLVQGYAQVFHGGAAYWGYRLGLEFVVCLTPALVLVLHRAGRMARTLVVPVVVYQVFAVGLGAVSGAGGAPVEQPWTGNSMVALVSAAPVLGVFLIVAMTLAGVGTARLRTPTDGDAVESEPHNDQQVSHERA